jgi:hypothetical protein
MSLLEAMPREESTNDKRDDDNDKGLVEINSKVIILVINETILSTAQLNANS